MGVFNFSTKLFSDRLVFAHLNFNSFFGQRFDSFKSAGHQKLFYDYLLSPIFLLYKNTTVMDNLFTFSSVLSIILHIQTNIKGLTLTLIFRQAYLFT